MMHKNEANKSTNEQTCMSIHKVNPLEMYVHFLIIKVVFDTSFTIFVANTKVFAETFSFCGDANP